HSEFVHDVVKMAERFCGLLENILTEVLSKKNTLTQPQRVALRLQRFDVQSGMGARHRKAHGVRAGVDRRDVDRLRHRQCYRQRGDKAEEGVYFVARTPSCTTTRGHRR